MNNSDPTLQMLFNQQLSEYREIKDLREKLRAAEMRHQALADEIQQKLTSACDCPPDCQGPDNNGNKLCRAELPTAGESGLAGPAPASDDTQSAGRGFSAVDALVEAQRNSRRFRDRVDAAFDEAAKARRGNPLYDLEWAT